MSWTKWLWLIGFLLCFSGPGYASSELPGEQGVVSEQQSNLALGLLKDWYGKDQEAGLTLHRDNYFIFTWGSEASSGSDSELKFQISAKQRIYGPFYIGYTQKSFWRIFDGADSRPFRETNHNPEILIRTSKFSLGSPERYWRLDVSPIEHESNGMTEPTSRSWNRAYVQPSIDYEWFHADWKLWFRWSEDVKEFDDDPTGDENPDIQDYYGNSELRLGFDLPLRSRLNLMGRYNFSKDKGAVQADFSWRMVENGNAWLYAQFWHGYGESLIDYNNSVTTYGAGFAFRPKSSAPPAGQH